MAKTQTRTAGKKVVKKHEKTNVPHGVVHVQASFNNTIISISDPWAICSPGFQRNPELPWHPQGRPSPPRWLQVWPRRPPNTASAAPMCGSGPGAAVSAIRAINAAGISVTSIRDVTLFPQWLPPAQAAPRLTRGDIPWLVTLMPSAALPPRRHETYLKGERCFKEKCSFETRRCNSRPARRKIEEAHRLCSSASRKTEVKRIYGVLEQFRLYFENPTPKRASRA